jgi:4-hydroxy-3-polyprenylbenzoate decarboxylase
MNVFLGITGASGAPYAARLLEALVAADVQVGLCISRAGYEILATELYRDTTLSHEQIQERFLDGIEGVAVHSEQDWRAPYASGSARVDGYVVCPCSMGTAGTIASGTMSNLIHRAASVALKEGRKLVLVPRETPLSDIHLENMLRLRRAGAVILMAAPGFYNAPESIDDLIEFVVGRCLDQLGIENKLTRRWGQE